MKSTPENYPHYKNLYIFLEKLKIFVHTVNEIKRTYDNELKLREIQKNLIFPKSYNNKVYNIYYKQLL